MVWIWLRQRRKKLILPTTTFESVGQGTWSFTHELPESPRTTQDVWGFMDSQETVEITQRDVYTIHHNIDKARRYVDIIKEEIENHWQQ